MPAIFSHLFPDPTPSDLHALYVGFSRTACLPADKSLCHDLIKGNCRPHFFQSVTFSRLLPMLI